MQKITELLNQCQNVALSSQAGEEHPFSSYASFHCGDEAIYVTLPRVSNHIENLEKNPKVSALFVESDAVSKPVTERYKATLECTVQPIRSEEEQYDAIMSNFQSGALGILLGTEDMLLYGLTVVSGEVTFGFGQVYKIHGKKLSDMNLKK